MRLAQHTLRELVLVKHTFREGERLSQSSTSPVGFYGGIILVHDAVMQFLLLLGEDLLVRALYKKTFPQLLEDIDTAFETSKRKPLPFKQDLLRLNDVRGRLHHQRIFPDKTAFGYLVPVARDFLAKGYREYFKQRFERVSLARLIRDKSVRSRVEDVERAVRRGHKEEAVVTMADLAFELFERSRVRLSQRDWESIASAGTRPRGRYEVPEVYGTDVSVELLQLGIDPARYVRFKWLTPQVVKDRRTDSHVVKWNKLWDVEENWTPDNLAFCFDFIVDLALKTQDRSRPGDEGLSHYAQLYQDEITATGDEASFYNQPSYGRVVWLNPPPRQAVFVLRTGETLRGLVVQEWDPQAPTDKEEVMVLSEDLPQLAGEGLGAAYVDAEEVEIRHVPRQR